MSASRVVWAAGVAAILAGAGCGQGGSGTPAATRASGTTVSTSATPSTSAATSTPLTFERRTPDVEATLTLPQQLAAYPAVHRQLFQELSREAEEFVRTQAPEHAGMVREGAGFGPFWSVTGVSFASESPRLAAFVGQSSDFTGGAHPNSGLWPLIIDRQTGARIQPASLFRPDADYARLDRALCDAIHAARRERTGETPAADDGFTCPTWRDSEFVPAPSTTPGKLGGLVFLFSPYAVGPYAEGAYEVTVSLSVFQAALKAEYAGEFAGAPAPLPTRPELTIPSAEAAPVATGSASGQAR